MTFKVTGAIFKNTPEKLQQRLGERFDPNKNYYVYCRSGARSAQACMIMNASGIANTFNLVGGVMNWTGDLVVD